MKNAKKLNKTKGFIFEMLACVILFVKGYKILKWNFKKSNTSQIDIVAEKNRTLYLIEVKYRKNINRCLLAIHPSQQKRLKSSAINISKEYKRKVLIEGMFFSLDFPFLRHEKNIF